jgi:dipeptidyl aminopeptidase/acylaminoacyl peptidase
MPSNVQGWIAAGEAATPWIALVANGKIATASGRDVWTLDDSGHRTSFAQLDEGWNAGPLSWAPDGGALAIGEYRFDADPSQYGCVLEGRVAVLDETGRITARSSPAPGTYDTDPGWSPDGSQIVFTREKHTCATQSQPGFPDVYVMPVSGGDERLVVSNATNAVLSPTGATFAYFRFDPQPTAFAGDLRGPEIWMVAADGSAEHRVGGRADDGQRERLSDHLAWAPDGSVVAFFRAVGEDLNSTEIDLIDSSGTIRSLGRIQTAGVRELSWMPDGRALVYTEARTGATEIVVLSPSGDVLMRFELSDSGVPSTLAISPDGLSLAWSIMGTSNLRVQPLVIGEARTYADIPSTGYVDWQALLLDQ